MIEAIFNQLEAAARNALGNQVIGTGVVLALMGALLASLRKVPGQSWALLKRQFIVSVEVMNNDPVYHWLSAWLDGQSFMSRVRDVTASVRKNVWGDTFTAPGETEGPKVTFTPAPGTHYFWYKGRLVLLTRERQESKERANAFTPPPEKFILRMPGRRQELLHELIADARKAATVASEARVSVFVSSTHGGWRRVSHHTPRPLETVILPAGLKDEIVEDIEKFLDSRDWYRARGVPWRRTWLFHGLPGTGKSSLVAALAGHFGVDLYMPNLTGSGMNDEALMSLMLEVPPKSFVLFEEISDVVEGREVKNVRTGSELTSSAITYGGLLNLLDGILTPEGVMVFMTTNQVIKLDESFVRPGRVDTPVLFTHAAAEQIGRMFLHFFPEAGGASARAYAEAVAGRRVTTADVQKHLLDCADPRRALETAEGCGAHIEGESVGRSSQ
ncbi:MAG TPA: AAA family ATPase [Pyrinomonadaceae bacterium]|nr:AAA family ATPase [Pyrinomonadaceae bacterium]